MINSALDLPPPGSGLLPLAAPLAPAPPQRHPFPVIASLAPVAGSVVIWAITQSAMALAFAFLGPVVAVASLVDAHINRRRARRLEASRFRREIELTREAIDERHATERKLLSVANPGARQLGDRPVRDPERWLTGVGVAVPVRLGLGAGSSSLRIEGLPAARRPTVDAVSADLERLRLHAAIIPAVPAVSDARLGIGICGPLGVGSSAARGILLQLANLLSPAEWRIESTGGEGLRWLGELPHRLVPIANESAVQTVRWRAGSHSVLVAVTDDPESVPGGCRVILRVTGGRATVDHGAASAVPVPLAVELISVEEAAAHADLLSRAAVSRGISPPSDGAGLPRAFSALPVEAGAPGSLACTFGWSDTGPVRIDLVAHGPHAVVGGMTGSGKSELLVSWILAIAAAHEPAAVNFLLVDFKGGSAFGPIQELPHVVGVVTDLDDRAANRALVSLRAELRYRERIIADAGARHVDDHRVTLPRLVIVVDEFAAMASDFPELHELFADLAARGRSLGLHLILCTQRPAGAIRDSVLANAALRVSLRVNNRADSIAVLGTTHAAELSADGPGHAFVSIGGGEPIGVRVALAAADDIARVRDIRTVGADRIRRPWCDELPSLVYVGSLDADARNPGATGVDHPDADDQNAGIPFGLLDLPERQTRAVARYRPEADGNLLVIGGQQSGKSTVLATIAGASNVARMPTTVDGSWDAVERALRLVRAAAPGPRVIAIDDLDALVGRFPEEYRAEFVDRLAELAREGASSGLALAVAVRRVTPHLQTLAGLFESRIVLRMPTRQDHLMAGGSPSGYSATAPPGSGEWRGSRIQVAVPGTAAVRSALEPTASPDSSTAPVGAPDRQRYPTLVVVTTRPDDATRNWGAGAAGNTVRVAGRHAGLMSRVSADPRLVSDGAAPTTIVGDPESWQANWSLLGSLRSSALMVFDRCSLADFRAISGGRALPPPLAHNSGQCWSLDPEGTIGRVLAPTMGPTMMGPTAAPPAATLPAATLPA